jgi:hypothetical protein
MMIVGFDLNDSCACGFWPMSSLPVAMADLIVAHTACISGAYLPPSCAAFPPKKNVLFILRSSAGWEYILLNFVVNY